MKKTTVRKNPKLEIKRETIKQIDTDQLGKVAGGRPPATGGAVGCTSRAVV
jgi:hypothetical protein